MTSQFSLMVRSSQWLTVLLFAGLVGGCGDEAPPYDVLPLRDALRAAPEVVATLPEESRRELALRFEEAARTDPETLTFTPKALNLEPLVTSADATRETAGKDAMMLGEILATEGHGLLEVHSIADADMANAAWMDVQGEVSTVALPFEEAALHGRAGKTLRALVTKTHAKSIVRMTGLPVGAVHWNDKVYVNESWLVAMSALEDACVIAPEPTTMQEKKAMPGPTPLSVEFNPYNLPGALAQCTAQVQNTCACANTMSCSHAPTDQTFSDGNAECTWVNQQPANAAAICVLALMTIGNVKECVAEAIPVCSFMPVLDRTQAVSFATDVTCVSAMDSCLQDGPGQDTSNSGSGSGDACSDCRYCDNKGNDCQECLSDCDTFLKACELCVEILDLCATTADRKQTRAYESEYKFAYVRPVSQCAVRPASSKPLLPTPLGNSLWLFAPVAYLFLRLRGRT